MIEAGLPCFSYQDDHIHAVARSLSPAAAGFGWQVPFDLADPIETPRGIPDSDEATQAAVREEREQRRGEREREAY